MTTDPDWAALSAAWEPARRAGVLGSASLDDLREHAAGYLPAACGVLDEFDGIDLGTGAGVPGILLALLRPRSRWTLVDASERRCEFARRAVRALEVGARVAVMHGRSEDVAHRPEFRERFDLVVGRLFGPPATFAESALALVREGGVVAVSVTDDTLQTWRLGLRSLPLDELETSGRSGAGQFLQLRRNGPVPAEWPRRAKAQSRDPILPD